jgi:hypothetical protein
MLQSSIIAGNLIPLGGSQYGIGEDFFIVPTNTVTADHCLIGVADGITLAPASANNLTGTLAAPLDPRLGPLANNGGTTQTCLPHLSSPAIDAGSNPANLLTDQRGNPRVQGSAADMGAIERTPGTPDATTGPLPSVTTGGGTSFQFTVTYSDATAVNAGTFGPGNVLVTGPGGFSQLAQPVSGDTGTGPIRRETYSITPPGGSWQIGALGTYLISMRPNQVFNTTGVAVPAMMLATFQVAIPQTYIVTSLADSGPGSLLQAMSDADSHPWPGTIQFDPALYATGPATINLPGSLPYTTRDLTIIGPGANLLSVRGGAIDVADNRTRTETVSGLTLDGIHTGTGTFTLLDSVVNGSGIQVGALGSLIVKGSTISGVQRTGPGGGISFASGGALDLENSAITGNSSAGGGGGIYFYGAVTPSGFTIRNSTIARNTTSAYVGGGIETSHAGGALVIQNSTITGNAASTSTSSSSYGGGGIATISSTVSAVIQSSIIAGNTGPTSPDVLFNDGIGSGGLVEIDHSLIGVVPAGFVFGSGSGNNLTGTAAAPLNPRLAPLGNFGGHTQTMPPMAGSPTLNAGSNPAGLTTDQRGSPRVAGPAPDIGAYEYQPIRVANVQVNDGSAQRSEVHSIAVTFSGAVAFAGGNANAAAAFQLQHVQDATNVNNLAAAVSTNGLGQTVVTLTFSTNNNAAAEIDPISAQNGGVASLADGRFSLTVLSSAVADAALGWALAGAGTGIPGSNYVSPADTLGGGPGELGLYRLFGDSTGDGIVDQLDLGQFRTAFNTGIGNPLYQSFLDADNSGTIDQIDLGQFRVRFNLGVF